MKVRELQKEIDRCKKEYGKDFLDWDVFVEWPEPSDFYYKKYDLQGDWRVIGELDDIPEEEILKNPLRYYGDDLQYIECHGFWTKMPKKKIFTINVNY